MNTSALKVYELFKEKWGKEEASMVINYLEKTTEEKILAEIKSKIEHFATKEDIAAVKEDIAAVREDMQKLHTSIIKWMFIFWVGTVGAIIGVIKFL